MEDFIGKEKKYLLQTYKRLPLIIVKGRGKFLWDINNKKYIDFTSGLSVCNIGHCPPVVIKQIHAQSSRLIHTSNLYYTIPQIELAELLINITFREGGVFLCNSGTEANEAVLKLAKLYKKHKKIIAMRNSFHGRTLGSLSITGQDIYKKNLEDLLIKDVEFVNLNDIEAVEKKIKDASCVMIELLQAEAGIYQANKDYVKRLRQLCDEYGVLLAVDEVQTGCGRCGSMFLYEKYEILPDVITLAKGLGSGIPIGAMIVKSPFCQYLTWPMHASTFGGGPLASTAALATLKFLLKNNKKLINNVDKLSLYIKKNLNKLKEDFPWIIKEVRGEGLLIGIEFLENIATDVVNQALSYGFILNAIRENIIRLAPPLIISKPDIDKLINVFYKIIPNFKK